MNTDRFKFRVWNKAENMYHYNAECAYDSMGGTPPLMDDSFGDVLCNDDYVVEQCTGLKDCKGKLIFEGDFVKITYRDQTLHYCVKYDQSNCQLYLSCGEMEFSESFDVLDNWAIEIIGNIHEDQFREVTKMVEGEKC